MIELDCIYNEDCLTGMQRIPDASIDCIICDPPYGTTACRWDVTLPLDALWQQYARVIRPDGAIVVFCSQPFTAYLVLSRPDWFRFMLYWRKSRPAGYVNCRHMPLRDIEEIAVFSPASTANGAAVNIKYRPQGLVEINRSWHRPVIHDRTSAISYSRAGHATERTIRYTGYPRQVLDFSNSNRGLVHPTQKPVPLIEYLVRTFSDEGDTVLDNCMGSGTTAVACIRSGRHFVGFETDPVFYQTAIGRIRAERGADGQR